MSSTDYNQRPTLNATTQRIKNTLQSSTTVASYPLSQRYAKTQNRAQTPTAEISCQSRSQWLEIQEPAPGAMKIYQELGFHFDAFGRLVIALKKS
ncbi:hypothetical protein CDA60_06030 [Pseudomonas fragi]|nr:hypothetical protein CDA60_06030 [Pseudomonas fragi]